MPAEAKGALAEGPAAAPAEAYVRLAPAAPAAEAASTAWGRREDSWDTRVEKELDKELMVHSTLTRRARAWTDVTDSCVDVLVTGTSSSSLSSARVADTDA
jgi:hypothetical protein